MVANIDENKPAYMLEVCANSTESSIAAEIGGASRVELCAGIPEGGTTPSYGEILTARKNFNLALNVIIRPRAGDFLYNEYEVEAMLADIKMCKELSVDGVVFGCLTSDAEVDVELCTKLRAAAGSMSTTFHRAFDVCKSPEKALEQIACMGFDRILTSGCKSNAMEGAELIKKLIDQSAGRVIIMPGCGVNESNIAELRQKTGAVEFHMSARESVVSQMTYRNPDVSMGGTVNISEYARDVTSIKRVAESLKQLTAEHL